MSNRLAFNRPGNVPPARPRFTRKSYKLQLYLAESLYYNFDFLTQSLYLFWAVLFVTCSTGFFSGLEFLPAVPFFPFFNITCYNPPPYGPLGDIEIFSRLFLCLLDLGEILTERNWPYRLQGLRWLKK